ncbi:MAG: energy-coupling factor transporter transmembrane protein EcfT [Coriobacteriales bacterium]|jgi:energy-coupling factor transport system permease protein|nr:energy-coupling factor transporter transmembrane protein EcfT [Coriobacteriales bacterium]
MTLAFDPRAKLLVLVLINVMIFVSPDVYTELLCMSAIALVLALMGCWRQLWHGLLVYVGLIGAFYLCTLTDNLFTTFIGMTIACIRKIMPTVFFTSGMMATTTVGDLVSALQKLHIPKVVVIPFTVMLRFFPTAKEEFAAIRDAAKLRGLRFGMERTLVPMMLRSANIAEELSAASVTRGIECTNTRTSIRELRLGAPDCVLVAVFFVLNVLSTMGGASLLFSPNEIGTQVLYLIGGAQILYG